MIKTIPFITLVCIILITFSEASVKKLTMDATVHDMEYGIGSPDSLICCVGDLTGVNDFRWIDPNNGVFENIDSLIIDNNSTFGEWMFRKSSTNPGDSLEVNFTISKPLFNSPQNFYVDHINVGANMNWEPPEKLSGEEVQYYNIYIRNNMSVQLLLSTPDTVHVPTADELSVLANFINGYAYVTAVYKFPEGESGPSNEGPLLVNMTIEYNNPSHHNSDFFISVMNDKLFFSSAIVCSELRIVNSQGQTINQTYNQRLKLYSIRNLQAGIYTVEISTPNSVHRKKVVIIR